MHRPAPNPVHSLSPWLGPGNRLSTGTGREGSGGGKAVRRREIPRRAQQNTSAPAVFRGIRIHSESFTPSHSLRVIHSESSRIHSEAFTQSHRGFTPSHSLRVIDDPVGRRRGRPAAEPRRGLSSKLLEETDPEETDSRLPRGEGGEGRQIPGGMRQDSRGPARKRHVARVCDGAEIPHRRARCPSAGPVLEPPLRAGSTLLPSPPPTSHSLTSCRTHALLHYTVT